MASRQITQDQKILDIVAQRGTQIAISHAPAAGGGEVLTVAVNIGRYADLTSTEDLYDALREARDILIADTGYHWYLH